MRQAFRRSNGFTLIELIVSITIFGIMMVSIFYIYANIISASKRLELARALQDNVRVITETIAADVRERGVDYAWYASLPSMYRLDYSGSGNAILAVKGGVRYSSVDEAGMPCTDAMMADLSKRCFLAVERGGNPPVRVGTADVKLRSVRFYVSGADPSVISNTDFVSKVTVNLELGIAAGRGLISRLVETSYVRVQTSIDARPYKSL